jgi:hypothetical protein
MAYKSNKMAGVIMTTKQRLRFLSMNEVDVCIDSGILPLFSFWTMFVPDKIRILSVSGNLLANWEQRGSRVNVLQSGLHLRLLFLLYLVLFFLSSVILEKM